MNVAVLCSSLDSATAMALCRTLAAIAQRGTTVLLSIHQPRADIFALFDRVVVLGEGGRVVFEGAPNVVPAYLHRALQLDLCPSLPKVCINHHPRASKHHPLAGSARRMR